MATVATGLMTADEFFDFIHRPENRDRFFELVAGKVVEMPSPGERHGFLCSWISHLLWGHAVQHGGGVSSNDTGLLLKRDPDTVRGPDVMFFAESRSLDDLSPRFATRIPRLIVEVLSPSDKTNQVNSRVSQYLQRGVPMVWLVDPETRTVAVYQPGQIHQVLDETEELAGGEVLPGLQCPVAKLFQLPGQ
jgi:Uma2 family endonuclease